MLTSAIPKSVAELCCTALNSRTGPIKIPGTIRLGHASNWHTFSLPRNLRASKEDLPSILFQSRMERMRVEG
jgi:hypothetical protein